MANNLTAAPPKQLPSLDAWFKQLDARPTPAAYRQAADRLRMPGQLPGRLRPVRVAMLSTFTIDSLEPYLEVEAARLGLLATDIYQAPFNSVRQELFSRNSGCAAHRPDVIFVTQLLEDVCPPLANDFLTLSHEQVEACIAETIDELVASLKAFRQHSDASVVISNFVLPRAPELGIFEVANHHSQTAAIRRANSLLVEAVTQIPGMHVLDLDRVCADVGYAHWRHEPLWYSGHAPLSPAALSALGRMQATYLHALCSAPRKCLVVDLDNTLWGGVIGEDGLAGIKIGQTYPGNIYRDLQQAILNLARRGVLLAICSKNNEADVDEVFQSHPDMLLRREHFAAARINWLPKFENVREIADELSIGLDSLVFLDDAPAECELMRQQLPEVLVWEAFDSDGQPAPLRALKMLAECRVFDKLSFTEDDRRRSQMYREQSVRKRAAASAASLEDFLTSLDMRVDIQPVTEFTLPRVVDLIHKTNQFNLTTRRHPAAQVQEFIADPNSVVLTVSVADRFGDNGVVGVAIARHREDVVAIDSFLLSCRVIGRTVETGMLSQLVDWAKERGAAYLQGEFIPTAKNAPAAGFLPKHGFAQVDGAGHSSRWLLDLEMASLSWPAHLQRSAAVDSAVDPAVETLLQATDDQRLLATVASVLGVAPEQLDDDASPETLPSWDSLNHLNLILALESEYGLSLSAADSLGMQSVRDIRRLVLGGGADKSASDLEFFDCRAEDVPAFKAFIAKSYSPEYVLAVNDAYFQWQYRVPDATEAYRLRLATVAGQIAGCMGYISVDVHVAGAPRKGCWLANWMVDPDFRHLGLGPMLVREVSRDFEVTLALGANEEARDLLRRMGWTDFDMLARYVCVLDVAAAGRLTESGSLDWPLSAPVEPSPATSGLANFAAEPDLRIEQVERLGEDAQELWDGLRGSDNRWAGTRRTFDYLNWRYAEHPQFDYRIFTARVGDRLLGLAVYRLEQARGSDLCVGRLVELIAKSAVEDALLSAVLEDARRRSAVMVDFFCSSPHFGELLARHGFLPGDHPSAQQVPMLYQPIDRRRAGIRFLADLRNFPEAASGKDWYVTKSDGDQDRPN
ncbi:MAG: HAD-IIIC family phosphatase [Aureliella sp.]